MAGSGPLHSLAAFPVAVRRDGSIVSNWGGEPMNLLKTLAFGAGLAILAAGTASAQTSLKVGHGHSEKHSFHLAMEKFSELLEQKAPGAFDVTLYPQATLGSEDRKSTRLNSSH